VLDIFRTLIYASSGACDYSVKLPHWSSCSWFNACWRFSVVGLEWYPCCRLKNKSCASACNMDTTPTQPHRISNTRRTKNRTTNMVIEQISHKFLMMDMLMSETCRADKKWNKIASDIKLVFYSSTTTMMHGPINIRFSIGHVCLVIYSLWLGRLFIVKDSSCDPQWAVNAPNYQHYCGVLLISLEHTFYLNKF